MNWWQQPAAAPCEISRQQAQEHQAQLTKPPGSLGRLEDIALQFAAWQGRANPQVGRVKIRVFAADHGVCAESVSAYPQEVTAQMIHNFATGGAAIAVLARACNADFAVVNLGTVSNVPAHGRIVDASLAAGTANMCVVPAMTMEQAAAALEVGARQVDRNYDLFIGGEMGIGNTTAAAAMTAALLDLSAQQTVGRGTGIDDAGLARKRAVVARAIGVHSEHQGDALQVLRRLGGFERAGLCGAYIAAAQCGVPVLVDGYISSVAALAACRLNASVQAWLLFAHRSVEPGHSAILQALSVQPLMDLGMRLGEASGAAVALPLIHAACALHNKMATFSSAGVSGVEAGGAGDNGGVSHD